MVKINITLSPEGINKAIKEVNKLHKRLKNINTEVTKELAIQTAEKVKEFYNNKGFESTNEYPSIGYEKTEKGYMVYARSTGIIYEEYGTGDIGMSSPHPNKPSSLKGYNTGATIRPALLVRNPKSIEALERAGIPENGFYWTYYDNTGAKVYTNGIPAGKFMYNSYMWLLTHKDEIIKKKVNDALSKIQ